jgi:DNA-3-methyladenine glycosylase II
MPAPATRPHWAAASAHLAGVDEVSARLLDRHGVPRIGPGAPTARRFEALARAIVHQQLAGAAAASIWARVLATVGDPFTPESVLATPPDALRSAGLSGAKAAAVTDLAVKVHDRTVRLGHLARLDDQAVIDHLVVVRGVGPWTAQMFLLFELRRLDVWPTGDLGVRIGLGRVLSRSDVPGPAETEALGAAYAPYRSVVAWWCWREADTRTPDR